MVKVPVISSNIRGGKSIYLSLGCEEMFPLHTTGQGPAANCLTGYSLHHFGNGTFPLTEIMKHPIKTTTPDEPGTSLLLSWELLRHPTPWLVSEDRPSRSASDEFPVI